MNITNPFEKILYHDHRCLQTDFGVKDLILGYLQDAPEAFLETAYTFYFISSHQDTIMNLYYNFPLQ